ncbi:MAG: sugar phosphate isomerase/epimerase [Armatimonadetes bacterium]|nr:sugar phosphate isomerase/epimerase [Armatimonadota bacterium]MDW8028009.1 sugar phosphate isomerase/epimerase family protein [Armatimonadota bacterium]
MEMEIGVAVSRIEAKTLEDDLKAWKRAGIAAVECDYPSLMEHPIRVLENWSKMFRDAEIRFWSVHAPFGGHNNLSHPDEKTRRRAVEFHKFILERTSAVGAGYLIVHPSSTPRTEVEKVKGWDWFRESLDELLPFAEEMGIVLAVENMLPDAAIGSDPAQLSGFLASYFSPHLKLCFDTGHAHIAGNAYLWLESVVQSVGTYHIADNDKGRDLHLPPGYGTVPWDLISPILQQSDFPLIVEAYLWQNSSWTQFRMEVEAVLKGEIVTIDVNGRKATARCFRCGRILIRDDKGKVICGCE